MVRGEFCRMRFQVVVACRANAVRRCYSVSLAAAVPTKGKDNVNVKIICDCGFSQSRCDTLRELLGTGCYDELVNHNIRVAAY